LAVKKVVLESFQFEFLLVFPVDAGKVVDLFPKSKQGPQDPQEEHLDMSLLLHMMTITINYQQKDR
jgi:hypothetical protein